eukprot:TRINITY_DN5410_c0_g1_i1.p1 TRINITY_DN5410_c0_g1~~TRINITY_DN5410_c0_g1_i1.p1  ORF type:complete len:226 (+),score=22.36 TRINITY_DN5410_c0_g1_i1:125-802(+)
MASSLNLGKVSLKLVPETLQRSRLVERTKANFFRPKQQQIVMHARSSIASLQNVRIRNTFSKRQERQSKIKDPVSPDKLDQWMQDSVSEIVRNIAEAPFLVHVYSENDANESSSSSTVLEREIAMAEIWPRILMRWEKGGQIPDGVILVEELKDEEEESDGGDDSNVGSRSSRSWGIVVQGRGVDCASCYILKTTRVEYCTHFCLVRADCFGESPELQMRNCWLQ